MLLDRLKSLGLELPKVAPPVASYIPAKRSGNLVFVSGQLPLKDGALLITGKMSSERSIEEAQAAFAQCFLNGIAAALLTAQPEEISGVVRLGAYVASHPEFTKQHLAANGASDLAQKIFGDAGVHARFAVGVPSLPLDAAVELEIIFQLTQ